MHYLLIRHKIGDFNHWKLVYDAQLPAREKAGLREQQLFRSMDNSSEVFLLMECDDVALARRHLASSATREAMNKAGVVGQPEITFLLSSRAVRKPDPEPPASPSESQPDSAT
jgi:hypothetical protein